MACALTLIWHVFSPLYGMCSHPYMACALTLIWHVFSPLYGTCSHPRHDEQVWEKLREWYDLNVYTEDVLQLGAVGIKGRPNDVARDYGFREKHRHESKPEKSHQRLKNKMRGKRRWGTCKEIYVQDLALEYNYMYTLRTLALWAEVCVPLQGSKVTEVGREQYLFH